MELKQATEYMCRGYAHNLLNMFASYIEYGWSRKDFIEYLRDYLIESKEQIVKEGIDYDDLVTYSMPEEYEAFISCTHKFGDWDDRIDNGSREMENVARLYLDEDFRHMTSGQLKSIGFKQWQDTDLHLIPLYLCKVFSDNDMVEHTSGKMGKMRQASKENMAGCIAFGIRAKAIIT